MKTSYFGNSWLGMFILTNDKFSLIPLDAPEKVEKAVSVLGTEVIKTTIANSNLLGIYGVMNSNGLILPNLCTERELKLLSELDINIYVSQDKHNAHGNNIAVNDRGGIINPHIPKEEQKRMAEVLGVELLPMHVAEHSTVGSCLLVTNKGVLINYKATETTVESIKNALGVYGNRGTLNMGSGFVGYGAIANSNGYVVGEESSPFEMGRLEEALDLIKG